jgi:hypothetical protein
MNVDHGLLMLTNGVPVLLLKGVPEVLPMVDLLVVLVLLLRGVPVAVLLLRGVPVAVLLLRGVPVPVPMLLPNDKPLPLIEPRPNPSPPKPAIVRPT